MRPSTGRRRRPGGGRRLRPVRAPPPRPPHSPRGRRHRAEPRRGARPGRVAAPPAVGPRCHQATRLGQVPPAQWRPGPLVAAAPLLGFEIEAPAGWASTEPPRLRAAPVAEDLRRQLPTPDQVDTYVLDPLDQSARRAVPGQQTLGGDISRRIRTGDARTTGSFPDGRRWLRTDGGTGRAHHRCAAVALPVPGWRALPGRALAPYAPGGAHRRRRSCPDRGRGAGLCPPALGPADHRAVAAGPARRPDCVDAATARPSSSFPASALQGSSRTVRIVWRFRASSHLIPRHLRRTLELSFLDDGQPVDVDGDSRRVLEGDLPEGMPLAPGELGVEWRWTTGAAATCRSAPVAP